MNNTQQIRDVASRAELVFSPEQLELAYTRMAEEISAKLSDSNPLILCTMIGGLIPTGILLPRLNFPLQVDYLHATRYRGNTSGSELHWLARPRASLRDRTVLIVDDVLDYGITLQAVVEDCTLMGAAQVFTAVLVEKKIADRPGLVKADFTGLVAEDRYLFGHGMDYRDYLRNADGIYAAGDEDV